MTGVQTCALPISEFSQTKQELLSLAKSGEITEPVLESNKEYQTLLSQTGLSATEAKSNILDLLTPMQRLNASSQGLYSLSKAYQEFTENGYVSANTLESMPDAFKHLKGYDFNVFESIVGDGASAKEEIQKTFNDIIAYYISAQETMKGVTEENKNLYITQLKEMGITNAKEAVNECLRRRENIQKTLNDYMAYIDEKGKADISYLNTLFGGNDNLVNALSTVYSTDYDNWINLLSKKTDAYNQFITAISQSQEKSLSSAL